MTSLHYLQSLIYTLLLKTTLFTLVVLFSFCALTCKKEPSPVAPPISVDTLLTSERQLASGQEPAVSPDGTKIAYTYQGNIYVMDTSGANQKQISSGGGDVMPRWSPDGQTIGFIRTTPGVFDHGVLCSVPASGGGATQLVFNEFVGDELIQYIRVFGAVGTPIWDWSPDGKYIALLQNADTEEGVDTATYLKIVDLSNGKEVYNIQTFNTLSFSNNKSSFQWSYNQNEIAFLMWDNQIYGFESICLLNLTSNVLIQDTTYTVPTFLTKNNSVQKFAFAIASNSLIGYNAEIVISDIKSAPLSYYHIYDGNGLRWSPDAKYFLYEVEQTVGGALGYNYSTLFLFNVERNKQYQLTFQGDIIQPHNLFFEWAKSGNTVYFERFGYINVVNFKQSN